MYQLCLIVMLGFCSVGSLYSASVASRPSVTKISLAQVAARLTCMQPKYEKTLLYHVLTKAERQKGMKKTVAVLLDSVLEKVVNFEKDADFNTQMFIETDWFALAIEALFLGSMKRLMQYKKEGDEEKFEILSEEVEVMKDAVFSLLQSAVNDASSSPRGSKDEIHYFKKKSFFDEKNCLRWGQIRRSMHAVLWHFIV